MTGPLSQGGRRRTVTHRSIVEAYQRALDKIAAAAAMYFIPPGMEPNFFVQKGFRLFTMPGAPWATAGIQNAQAGIQR